MPKHVGFDVRFSAQKLSKTLIQYLIRGFRIDAIHPLYGLRQKLFNHLQTYDDGHNSGSCVGLSDTTIPSPKNNVEVLRIKI